MRDWECENVWKGFSIAICLIYTSVQCQSICFWCSLPVSVSLCCILYSMSVSLCCILSYNTSVLYVCAVLGILHMSVTAEFHCCALLHCPLVWWWSPWQAVGSGQTILECGSRCSWWWRRQCFSQYAPTHPPHPKPHRIPLTLLHPLIHFDQEFSRSTDSNLTMKVLFDASITTVKNRRPKGTIFP